LWIRFATTTRFYRLASQIPSKSKGLPHIARGNAHGDVAKVVYT
jgi:hypothetical protein